MLISINQSGFSADDPAVAEAQRIFKQYSEMEHQYDPLQADLYANAAVIKDTRIYQDGQSKTLNWSGESYKQIVKARMPVLKARNEQFSYSQMSFTREGNNVRVRCQRFNQNKKFSSPVELLIGKTEKNAYKIIEESFQSQP